MRKKIFFAFLILVLLASLAVFYLNKIVLPIKAKSLIIKSLQGLTQKEVTLDALQFSIFKGLVIRNLVISGNEQPLISLKEVCATFLIPPIFKKTIVIPNLRIKSPVIRLERRQDGTFNLQDLLPKKAESVRRGKFGVAVLGITITDAQIDFRDQTLVKPFVKKIENLDLDLKLFLPASVRFNFQAQIPTKPAMELGGVGEFIIPEKKFLAKVNLGDFSPKEFLAYYQDYGISVSGGLMNATINLNLNGEVLRLSLEIESKNLAIEKEKISLLLNAKTKGDIKYRLKDRGFDFSGTARISNSWAMIKLREADSHIEQINGGFTFEQDRVRWVGLNFKYKDVLYQTKGVLANFRKPIVQLGLNSRDLNLKSAFLIQKEQIKLSRLEGRYLNSEFLMRGVIDATRPAAFRTDLNGQLNLQLKDLKVILNKFKKKLEEINPQGQANVQFHIVGDITDLKSALIQAEANAPSLSFYGLRAEGVSLNYNQEKAQAQIPAMRMSMYDGTVEANGRMSFDLEKMPFELGVQAQGLKLEKLKLDTAAKEKDIAGTIQAQLNLNGFAQDLSTLNGGGNLSIAEGRLWQINLFKGLGALLFTQDFTNIVFNEGNCSFSIKDKYIFSEDVTLKSKITDLTGPVKIGFDHSIDALLNVHVLDEMVPLSGTFRDVTTVILGQAGKFGSIRISGTLKEPKYKFESAVTDIIKGVKEVIFGK